MLPYSAIVYIDGSTVYAEDAEGNTIAQGEAGVDDASVIQNALDEGGVIVLAGVFDLADSVVNITKALTEILGSNAWIENGVIKTYVASGYLSLPTIRRIAFNNATLSIDNAFHTTVERCRFINGGGISIESSITWSENTRIVDCDFDNTTGIVFKTPTGTGSYINTYIEHCTFNLREPGQRAIEIQQNASIMDSVIKNVKIWAHADNISCIYIDGNTNTASFESVHF